MLESGPGVASQASIAAPRSPSASEFFTVSMRSAGMIFTARMQTQESMMSASVASEVRKIMSHTIRSIAVPPKTTDRKLVPLAAGSSAASAASCAQAGMESRRPVAATAADVRNAEVRLSFIRMIPYVESFDLMTVNSGGGGIRAAWRSRSSGSLSSACRRRSSRGRRSARSASGMHGRSLRRRGCFSGRAG